MINDFINEVKGSLKRPGGGSGGSVQSDWNQSDKNASDHIKNRPFWTGDVTDKIIVDETTVSIPVDTEYPTYWIDLRTYPDDIYVGQNYQVTWNDTVYDCVGIDDGYNGAYIGNPAIWYEGYADQDNRIPFCIYCFNGTLILGVFSVENDTEYKLKVTTGEIVKIGKQYLPNDAVVSTFAKRTVPVIHLDGIIHDENFSFFMNTNMSSDLDINAEQYDLLMNIANEYQNANLICSYGDGNITLSTTNDRFNMICYDWEFTTNSVLFVRYDTIIKYDYDTGKGTVTYKYDQKNIVID